MYKHNVVEEVIEFPVSDVRVGERYRKTFNPSSLDELAESIYTTGGNLSPIWIRPDGTLLAGERRLRATRMIINNPERFKDSIIQQKRTIRAIVKTDTAIEDKTFELVENLHREDFTWQEKVLAIEDLHAILTRANSNWSERKTAEKAGLANSNVSTDLNLADALKQSPELFEGVKSRAQALKVLQKAKIDEAQAELKLRKEKTNYGMKAKNVVFLGDCNVLVDELQRGLVNAVICDPIYGIDIGMTKKLESSPQTEGRVYADSEASYYSILRTFISKMPRILKPNAWVCIFCVVEYHSWLVKELTGIGFTCDPEPGIWYRGGSGQCRQPNHYFGHTYEAFVYGFRGEAVLAKAGRGNLLSFTGVPSIEKDHPVQKPLGLMEELIDRFCLPGQIVLDFMCGSGTTLLAAIKRGCIPIGFELDPRRYNVALSNVADAIKCKDAGRLDLIGARGE